MNRFAELLDRLTYEGGRNSKLRLMTDYFRSTADPERGWALAALTGSLRFPHAKPGLIRNLIAERTDPVLFELSYDDVGTQSRRTGFEADASISSATARKTMKPSVRGRPQALARPKHEPLRRTSGPSDLRRRP